MKRRYIVRSYQWHKTPILVVHLAGNTCYKGITED